ncbi:MAG: hydrogenase expression/formation protein HypE [Thermoanaerobaculum sp.]|nr:MAG: hydrogenase expression/formation protein HypE [Thermoanaerobaculum sp.]
MSGKIVLAHGGGGRLTRELVKSLFLPPLANDCLNELADAAVLPPVSGHLAFTTDAFVVDPPIFPGGDLGYLSVCGTVNDLAMVGARPLALSWALILEEGAEEGFLRTVVEGAARACREVGVSIVAGDTKVVPRGKGDRAFVTTAGVGAVQSVPLSDRLVVPGDEVLVSGPVGDHGATVLAARHGLGGELASDVAPLWPLVERLLASGVEVHALHDPTRGGVATVCYEVAERTGLRVELEETAIPVRPAVKAVMEVLGLDPLYVACEGRFLAFVAAGESEKALSVLREHPLGQQAQLVGAVRQRQPGEAPVVLRTAFGTLRPLDLLSGAELPRIC